MAKTNTFDITILNKDGSKTKLDLTTKLASSSMIKGIINKPQEIGMFSNKQTVITESNGKVFASVKSKVNDLLADNTYASLPNVTKTSLLYLDVEIESLFYDQKKISNFDRLLAKGKIPEVLTQHQAFLFNELLIEGQKRQYKRFEALIDSFKPWKTDLTGPKTVAALNAGQTIDHNITFLKNGGRKLIVKATELATKGNFLKLFDELIMYIKLIGIKGKSGEGQIRVSGGVNAEDIIVLVDERYRKLFLEGGQIFFDANAISKVNDRITSYNGVTIVFKKLGDRPFYAIVKNTWTYEPMYIQTASIDGTPVDTINNGERLLPGDKVYTYASQARIIAPDKHAGLAWSIEFS